MKITIKIKYLLVAVAALGFLGLFSYGAAAEGPRAYIRYAEQEDTVTASVYWDDTSGYSFHWANDINPAENDLDWNQVDDWNLKGTDKAYVNISLDKYKNYYFKISKGADITIVRAFPGDLVTDDGPNKKSSDYAHGNFTPDTTMCGSCHDTHSSIKSQLLKQSTYYDLCMLCHSNSNSQSKYDVEMGRTYMGTMQNGTYVGWVDSLGGPVGTGVGSSAHDVNDNINTTVNVPGGSTGGMLTFTCISCHTAHGGSNDNYRLLRNEIYPEDGVNPVPVNFKAFSVVKDDFTKGEQVYLVSGSSEFCIACHTNFDPGTSGGHLEYEHPVTVGSNVYSVYSDSVRNLFPSIGDNLPLQYDENAQTPEDKRTAVVCQTCHFAHGTKKSYVINRDEWPVGDTTGSEGSAGGTGKNILRMDNYGVCQSCHKK